MRGRRLIGGLIAAGVLAFPVAAAAEAIRVAMLPVAVHAASGDADYLSQGLAEMLSARLEQAGGIQVIRLESNSRTTTNAEVAISAGEAAGAEYVVFGSFTQFGSGASLDIRCARVADPGGKGDPESRRVFIQSGDLADIIPRLEDLSGRIVQFLRGGAAAAASGGSGATRSAGSAGSAAIEALERRVQALERAVFEGGDSGGGGPAAGEE